VAVAVVVAVEVAVPVEVAVTVKMAAVVSGFASHIYLSIPADAQGNNSFVAELALCSLKWSHDVIIFISHNVWCK
jgi:hypothetical protein